MRSDPTLATYPGINDITVIIDEESISLRWPYIDADNDYIETISYIGIFEDWFVLEWYDTNTYYTSLLGAITEDPKDIVRALLETI